MNGICGTGLHDLDQNNLSTAKPFIGSGIVDSSFFSFVSSARKPEIVSRCAPVIDCSRSSEVKFTTPAAYEAATAAQAESERATREFQNAYREWFERTRTVGLPGDVGQLVQLRDKGFERAETLRQAAALLSGKLAERLDRAIASHSVEEATRRLAQPDALGPEARRIIAGDLRVPSC